MNHAFITVKGSVNPDTIDQAIRQAAKTFFKGVLTVERDEGQKSWWVGHPDNYRGVSVFIKNHRRIDLRRGALGEFTGWIQAVLQCEVGKAVEGRCGDEGITERWAPDDKEWQFPTWKSYFNMMFSHCPKLIANRLWKCQLKALPDDLKVLANEDSSS
jgi:hypothetical protein